MGSMPATWSRFVRFISTDDEELCGEPVDEQVDVGLALASGQKVQVRVLDVSSALDEGSFTGETATVKTLLSPLSARETGTIRCIGLNFKDHAAELNCALPDIPTVFLKPASTLANPSSPIPLPRSAPDAIDAEVELAIIISQDCKDVPVARAADYILGYTCANDVTSRDVQAMTSQWGYSKGYDAFCPLGPAIVRQGVIPDIHKGVKLTTVLDGEVLQDGRTDEMIFSVEEIVSYLSQDSTLAKGTVIITGTPSGIGHGRKPPRYLKPGCELHVGIQPGIGTLTNTVIAASKL